MIVNFNNGHKNLQMRKLNTISSLNSFAIVIDYYCYMDHQTMTSSFSLVFKGCKDLTVSTATQTFSMNPYPVQMLLCLAYSNLC